MPRSERERTTDHDNYAHVRPVFDRLTALYGADLDASMFAARATCISKLETAASNCYQYHECIRDSCSRVSGDAARLAALKRQYIRDGDRLHVNVFTESFSAGLDLDTFVCTLCEKKKHDDPGIRLNPMSVGFYPSSSDARLCASNDNTTWFSRSLLGLSKEMALPGGVSFARKFKVSKGG